MWSTTMSVGIDVKKSHFSSRSVASKYTIPRQPSSAIFNGATIKSVGLRVDEMLYIVESSSANACVVHHRKLTAGDVGPHRSDAPRPAIRVDQCIDRRSIVSAVARRLDNDIAQKSEPVTKRKQLLLARVARGIFADWRVWECSPGPKTWQWASTAPGGSAKAGLPRDGSKQSNRRPFGRHSLEHLGLAGAGGQLLRAETAAFRFASRRGKTRRALPSKMECRCSSLMGRAST